jgi:hypothetical protein
MHWYAYPIMAGGSVLSGYLAGRPKTTTQTQTTTYTPEQTALQRALLPRVQERFENPALDLAPLRTEATGRINKTYDSLTKRMEQALVSRGFGRGGKLALGTRTMEMGRAGDLSDLEAKLATMQQEHADRTIDEATRFAFGYPSGSTASSTTPDTSVAQGVGGGLETIMTLYTLSKLLGK